MYASLTDVNREAEVAMLFEKYSSRFGLLKLPPPRQVASAVSLSAAWIWIKRAELTLQAALFIANCCCKNVFISSMFICLKIKPRMAAQLICVNLGFGSGQENSNCPA